MIDASSKILSTINSFPENIIVYLLLGLQIIFSPLQSGFSDYYLRRKSIIISLSATLISVILLKLSINYGVVFLILSITLKGFLGNTLPMAWAGIADITQAKNIRFALALSICALAIGSWGSLLILPHLIIDLLFGLVVIILVFGIGAAIYPFQDLEDFPKPHFLKNISPLRMIIDESKTIYYISKKPLNFICLLSFFFSEVSFYQILFRIEVFNNYQCFIYLPASIGIGYTSGTLSLKFIKNSDKSVSLIGLVISIISIVVINLLFMLNKENQFSFTLLFACYSFGYALFTPAIFSLITPRKHPHLQGKIYGILDSTDSLASLITFIILFMTKNMVCSFVLLFSTGMILISGVFFIFIYRNSYINH